MAVTRIAFLGLIGVVGLLRLVELRISRRNERRMIARGARTAPDPSFRWMVLLHIGVLAGAAAVLAPSHYEGFGLPVLEAMACGTPVLGTPIGAIPETGLAEGAGLAVANGVAVDSSLRTEDPAIFAAGDCCSFPHPLYGGRRLRLEAWRNAHIMRTEALKMR